MKELRKQYFKKMETVKIRTLKGRIITLSITGRTTEKIIGNDLYGTPTIVPIKEIESMLPIHKE